MPKSRHKRLSRAELNYRNIHRVPADLSTGGATMGKLIKHPSTPVPKELREKRANYNKLQRTPPELIWGNGTPFVGSIRATFTGARRNNRVASAIVK